MKSEGNSTWEVVPETALMVGDVVEVCWSPYRDTIIGLRPYAGPLEILKGGQIATYASRGQGVTIEPGDTMRRIVR